jgi:hypothetical protein
VIHARRDGDVVEIVFPGGRIRTRNTLLLHDLWAEVVRAVSAIAWDKMTETRGRIWEWTGRMRHEGVEVVLEGREEGTEGGPTG